MTADVLYISHLRRFQGHVHLNWGMLFSSMPFAAPVSLLNFWGMQLFMNIPILIRATQRAQSSTCCARMSLLVMYDIGDTCRHYLCSKWHLVGESQFAVGHTYVASQVTSVCSTVACVELRQSADGANDLWTLSFDFQDLFDLPGQTRGQGGGLHACHPHYGAT
eukprot:scaffold23470_cov24-Tisochrysis_lutea.AAC.1